MISAYAELSIILHTHFPVSVEAGAFLHSLPKKKKRPRTALAATREHFELIYSALCIELLCLRRANGAGACACAAVDARARVDNVFAVALGNSGSGAVVCARAASDAVIGDNISHDKLPP